MLLVYGNSYRMRVHAHCSDKGGIGFRDILNGGLGKKSRLLSNKMYTITVLRKINLQYLAARCCTLN